MVWTVLIILDQADLIRSDLTRPDQTKNGRVWHDLPRSCGGNWVLRTQCNGVDSVVSMLEGSPLEMDDPHFLHGIFCNISYRRSLLGSSGLGLAQSWSK